MLIVIGILFLISLVIVHELGHFWAARRAGVEVEEFGIGFPPRAKVLGEKDGTVYTLNWLPLGGFVKLKGEHDSDTEKGSFGAARLRDKIAIMVAGVVMNVLAAIVLLSIVAAVGMPKVLNNQFSVASDSKIVQQDVVVLSVAENSPAAQSGLAEGDIILGIVPADSDITEFNPITENRRCEENGSCYVVRLVFSSAELRFTTEGLAGEEVKIGYKRDGKNFVTTTKLLSRDEVESSKNTDNPKGYLGVTPSDYTKQQSTWSAPIVGAVTTGQFFWETLKSLGGIIADLFRGEGTAAKEQVTGVVGIGYLLNELSKQGFMSVLFLTAIISVSLAVMNILPIPALDGGRLFVTLLFRFIRKPLHKDIEERIHGTGFALLMLLFVLITIFDVQKFIIN